MEEKLRELLKNSYSPVYNYKVAAIVKCNDGSLFYGVNVETSSPASGICAERNALYNAVTNGCKKGNIKEIHIMNATERECYPCFICRQALNDFCEDAKIYTYNYSGTIKKCVTVKELCPYSFTCEDINVK